MRKLALETRKLILDTAELVIRSGGISRLTIDAVSNASGISKGGVLYHFSSKQALVKGMLDRMLESFERDLEDAYRAEEPGPGQWLRAYARISFQKIKT